MQPRYSRKRERAVADLVKTASASRSDVEDAWLHLAAQRPCLESKTAKEDDDKEAAGAAADACTHRELTNNGNGHYVCGGCGAIRGLVLEDGLPPSHDGEDVRESERVHAFVPAVVRRLLVTPAAPGSSTKSYAWTTHAVMMTSSSNCRVDQADLPQRADVARRLVQRAKRSRVAKEEAADAAQRAATAAYLGVEAVAVASAASVAPAVAPAVVAVGVDCDEVKKEAAILRVEEHLAELCRTLRIGQDTITSTARDLIFRYMVKDTSKRYTYRSVGNIVLACLKRACDEHGTGYREQEWVVAAGASTRIASWNAKLAASLHLAPVTRWAEMNNFITRYRSLPGMMITAGEFNAIQGVGAWVVATMRICDSLKEAPRAGGLPYVNSVAPGFVWASPLFAGKDGAATGHAARCLRWLPSFMVLCTNTATANVTSESQYAAWRKLVRSRHALKLLASNGELKESVDAPAAPDASSAWPLNRVHVSSIAAALYWVVTQARQPAPRGEKQAKKYAERGEVKQAVLGMSEPQVLYRLTQKQLVDWRIAAKDTVANVVSLLRDMFVCLF